MKYVILVVRTLLGLAFLVFGLEYFVHFLPLAQPEPTAAAGSLLNAIVPTGYLKVVKIIEVTGGALLFLRIFVPLGLVLLTPVIVNIFLYDTLLMGQVGMGLPLLAMAVFLIWSYRPYFASLFAFNAKPAGCCSREA